MKILSALLLSATLVAGGLGSAAAYHHQSAPDTSTRVAATPQHQRPAAQAVQRGHRFAWKPCPPRTSLEKGACVTDVVRTVVVPAPPVVVAAAAVAAPAPAPQPAAAPAGTRGHDRGGEAGDDHGDGGGEHQDGGEGGGGEGGGGDD